MKKVTSLILALFLWFSVSWAQTIQIGTGSTTNSTFPISSCWGYSYTQQIYTKAQINTAGNITKIKFFYVSGVTTNSLNWNIYLGHTTKTTFATTTDWVPLSGLNLVYSGNVTYPAAGNWMEITLSTPFAYNNIDNLVVAVDENTPNYTCSINWYSFTSGTNTGIYYRADATNPDPASPPTASGRSGILAQVQLVLEALTGPANPSGFSATTISSSQINLGWNLNPAANNVMVAFNTSNTFGVPVSGTTYAVDDMIAGGGQVLSNSNATAYSHTGLIPNTNYYYKAWSVNGAIEYSGGVATTAKTLCAIETNPFTQGFEAPAFPPDCWSLVAGGTYNWQRSVAASGYGVGTASAYANFFSISSVVPFDLVTMEFNIPGAVLQFDHAYAGYSSVEIDKLKILYSTDGGANYTQLVELLGGPTGPLNTYGGTGLTTSSFVPTSTQWATKLYTLPAGTNKVKFQAISAYGNNLYLDNISVYVPAYLTGVVKDAATNSPIQGAVVKILPSGPSATTLADGTYSLTYIPGTFDISCTALGYANQSVNTTLIGGSNTLDFNMVQLYMPTGLTAEVNLKDVNLTWTAPSYFPAKENITLPSPQKPEYLPALPGQIAEDICNETVSKENLSSPGPIPPQDNGGKSLLYDNGQFTTGSCVSTGIAESSIQPPHNSYGYGFPKATGLSIADDFIVPAGETWKITDVVYYGYQTNSGTAASPFTGAFVRIWNGNPMAGGQVIWGDFNTNLMTGNVYSQVNRVSSTGTCNTARPIWQITASIPGLILGQGTYWVEYCVTSTGTPFAVPLAIPGSLVTGNAIQYVNGTWGALVSPPATVNYQGMAFKVNGSKAEPAPNVAGYKVYRDGTFLADVEAAKTEYSDLNLLPATYSYGVSAVYTAPTEGESFKAGPVEAIVYGCQRPQNLTAINLTPNSADLDWTEMGEATEWVVEWGLSGFAQGTGTLITGITAHPYTLDGLDFPVAYSFYVKAICSDDESIWAGPYTFTTPCAVWDVPFNEDFTGMPAGTTLPLCWEKLGLGASNWLISETSEAGGTSPELFLNWTPSFTGVSIVGTPEINTTGQTQLILSFKHFFDDYDGVGMIGVATTSENNPSWNIVWAFDPALATNLGPETMNLVVETPDVGSSTLRFGFFYSGYSFNIDAWYIDDLVLTFPPTIDADPTSFNFNMLPGDVVEEVLTVTNNGSWPVSYTVAFEASKASEWVTLSDSEGTLEIGGSKEIGVTFKAADLEPGLYSGNIVFVPDPNIGNVYVPVNVNVLSMIAGVVYDDNTDLPIEGAEVTFTGYGPVYTDVDGSYGFYIVPGTYSATIKAVGFCDLTVNDINVGGYNFTQDFYITAPIFNPIPDPVIKGLEVGTLTGSFEMVLLNPGTCDLPFVASELSDWLSLDILNGVILAGEESSMVLTFDATGLAAGIYETMIHFDLAIIPDADVLVKLVIGDQVINFENQQGSSVSGWSGVSANHLPGAKAGVEEILAPYLDQLVIMLGKNVLFWPEYNINTIVDWNPYEGYKFKFAEPMSIVFTGPEVSPKIVPLSEGVSFVPILSDLPILTDAVLAPVLPNLIYLFDIYNWKANWPAGGLHQIDFLEPGLAYLIRLTASGSIDFDLPKHVGTNNFKPIVNNTTWNDVYRSGSQHIISVMPSALNKLEYGDYIGVFNAQDLCVGMAQYTENKSLALITCGDDFTTSTVDGLQAGEMMSFKVYRSGEEFVVDPIYDPTKQNFTGMFEEGGLTAIIDFKMGATSINENPLNEITVYPNPSSGIVNIDLKGLENVEMVIMNAQGQIITRNIVSDQYQLNLGNQPKGVYMVKFMNGTQLRIEKLIIK